VPLLRAFASSRRGRLAAKASRIVSKIETAMNPPGLPLRRVVKGRRAPALLSIR
jgi:hypothetical protein